MPEAEASTLSHYTVNANICSSLLVVTQCILTPLGITTLLLSTATQTPTQTRQLFFFLLSAHLEADNTAREMFSLYLNVSMSRCIYSHPAQRVHRFEYSFVSWWGGFNCARKEFPPFCVTAKMRGWENNQITSKLLIQTQVHPLTVLNINALFAPHVCETLVHEKREEKWLIQTPLRLL